MIEFWGKLLTFQHFFSMPDFGQDKALDYSHIRYIVGIDEAGRGPIAGPVAVGAVKLALTDYHGESIRDSKQLPQHKREAAFLELLEKQKAGTIRFAVSMVSHTTIDAKGLTYCIDMALKRCLKKIDANPNECLVLLDGGLRAPAAYAQKTIIKGDERVYPIALASIAAKVRRDALMRRMSARYPYWGFEQHKGYGTSEHYKQIKKHGCCTIHRMSFLKGLTQKSVVVG